MRVFVYVFVRAGFFVSMCAVLCNRFIPDLMIQHKILKEIKK